PSWSGSLTSIITRSGRCLAIWALASAAVLAAVVLYPFSFRRSARSERICASSSTTRTDRLSAAVYRDSPPYRSRGFGAGRESYTDLGGEPFWPNGPLGRRASPMACGY